MASIKDRVRAAARDKAAQQERVRSLSHLATPSQWANWPYQTLKHAERSNPDVPGMAVLAIVGVREGAEDKLGEYLLWEDAVWPLTDLSKAPFTIKTAEEIIDAGWLVD